MAHKNAEDETAVECLTVARLHLQALASSASSISEMADRQLSELDAAVKRMEVDGPAAWQRQQKDGTWVECPASEVEEFERLGFKTRPLYLTLKVNRHEMRDAERLDFIERMVMKSPTGVSFDHTVGPQFRMMWKHALNPFAADLRDAIDKAISSNGKD